MALDKAVNVENEDDLDGAEKFDPASMPLGTFAAFPVSDETEWLPYEDGEDGEDRLTQDQSNAIDGMVRAVAMCEPTARRLEVQAAWRMELMDRGFHNLVPAENFGWEIAGTDSKSKFGPYGSGVVKGHYPTNVIGAHNDILVSALTRDVPQTRFFPAKPGDDGCITAADAANKLKHFIAQDNDYKQRVSEAARFFMTDDRVAFYMAPWADAQMWGYEDETPAVVPETEGQVAETTEPVAAPEGEEGVEPVADAGAAEGDDAAEEPEAPAKRPRIRSLLKLWGKLSHKCPLMANGQRQMAWQQIADEWDIAMTKAAFPWIADKIKGGGCGIAEISLDRTARCTVKLALQRTTGDSITRDTTVLFTWVRPEMYMDDSCPKRLRKWFWKTFPKGFLAVHAGTQLAFARNEGMDECLKIIHSRSGVGQNRRAVTEAYVNPQLRLNNWVDLIDEFFRKTIPRVGLRADVWDVDKMRSSSVRVGTLEPFVLPPGEDVNQTMGAFPMPTHQPTLPDFIRYFAGELAELLTGAMPTLSASSQDDPETLGQSVLQNGNAMGRMTESWGSLEDGFCAATEMGVRWAARVQPDDAEFDSQFPDRGRISVKIADLQGGDVVAHPAGSANFPESWEQREARWKEAIEQAGSGNPFFVSLVTDPRNAAQAKQFMPPGAVIPNADAVEKQQGEFEVLLKTGPIPNPKKAALEGMISKLQGTIRQAQLEQEQTQQPIPELEQMQAMLQQAQQALQGLPDEVSSVPVRGDGSENDAVEALVTLGLMNAPEGRRLSVSKKPEDVAAWKNLMLHWQEHTASEKTNAAKNQQPLIPKVSATVAVDKLAPAAQATALQEMGLPIQAPDVEQPLQPHEVTRTTKGMNAAGAETEETVAVSGRKL